jgi:hypothetical protein
MHWKRDIDANGIEGTNPHRYYYEKVQELLAWGIYYCGCALNWIYNTAEKQAEEEGVEDGLDPNAIAEHGVRQADDGKQPEINPEAEEAVEEDSQLGLKQLKDFLMLTPLVILPPVLRIIGNLIKRED